MQPKACRTKEPLDFLPCCWHPSTCPGARPTWRAFVILETLVIRCAQSRMMYDIRSKLYIALDYNVWQCSNYYIYIPNGFTWFIRVYNESNIFLVITLTWSNWLWYSDVWTFGVLFCLNAGNRAIKWSNLHAPMPAGSESWPARLWIQKAFAMHGLLILLDLPLKPNDRPRGAWSSPRS